jgi:hypothetical protein
MPGQPTPRQRAGKGAAVTALVPGPPPSGRTPAPGNKGLRIVYARGRRANHRASRSSHSASAPGNGDAITFRKRKQPPAIPALLQRAL